MGLLLCLMESSYIEELCHWRRRQKSFPHHCPIWHRGLIVYRFPCFSVEVEYSASGSHRKNVRYGASPYSQKLCGDSAIQFFPKPAVIVQDNTVISDCIYIVRRAALHIPQIGGSAAFHLRPSRSVEMKDFASGAHYENIVCTATPNSQGKMGNSCCNR